MVWKMEQQFKSVPAGSPVMTPIEVEALIISRDGEMIMAIDNKQTTPGMIQSLGDLINDANSISECERKIALANAREQSAKNAAESTKSEVRRKLLKTLRLMDRGY